MADAIQLISTTERDLGLSGVFQGSLGVQFQMGVVYQVNTAPFPSYQWNGTRLYPIVFQDPVTDSLMAGGAAILISPVTITGSAVVGANLTAALRTGWIASNGQWDRAGSNIGGETTFTHAVTLADSHKTLGFTPSGIPYRATVAVPILPYLGNVGTNLTLNNSAVASSAKSSNGRIPQVATEDFTTAPRPVFANWYVAPATLIETALPGTLTISASIEYPAGVPTQCKWGGATTNVAASGDNTLAPDAGTALVGGTIPRGAIYWINVHATQSAGLSFSSDNSLDIPNGGAWDFAAAGLSDLTMTPLSLVNKPANTNSFGPVAILYSTLNPTVAAFGNSKDKGFADTWNGANARGQICRSFTGNLIGNANYGIPSDKWSIVVGGYAKRFALAAYHSDVIFGDSINDFSAGDSAATVKANLQTLWTAVAAANPNARIWQATCTPKASGTFVTLGGQTVDANNAARVTFNTDLRGAVPAGLSGIFDPCSAIESSLNSGKWQIPSYTADGTHGLLVANLAVVSGGVYPGATFAR